MKIKGVVAKTPENVIHFGLDFLARIRVYRKKNISLAQLPMLITHSQVLTQNMKNFTRLYGSHWEAVKKMDQIIGGNIQWKE